MITQSENIVYTQNGIIDLLKELRKPFTRISLLDPNQDSLISKNRWISRITLWEDSNSGLQISSKMYDLAERLEAGCLSFKRVSHAYHRDQFYKLPASFSSGTLIQKIILHEAGKRIETGVAITAPDDAQIVIVPNCYPYALAIQCSDVALQHFEPEYPMEEYSIENWS